MKKVIVITGGNSGLGKETAKLLLKGNKVIILGKNSRQVQSVSKKFGCDGIICDVTDPKQVKDAFLQTVKKYKRIDCLINCAGIWMEGPIDKNKPENIRNTILVNTFGTILTTSIFVSQMKKQKSGRIINIISQAGLYPRAERSVYNASKWAITGFTKCLQAELAPYKISVVGVYPGFMRTKLFGKASARIDFSTAMPVSKVAGELKHLVDIDPDLVVREFGIQSIKQI
jgi:NAD(P)-dependent dehydrogenase (short-subunit alcohol dehydrogenase family)